MAERNLPAALKTSLIANEEYTYLHLVKFEKPRSSATGLIAGKATDYAYITDAAVNVSFDDGSVDSRNNANGTQTYVANKLLKVGTVSETTEARASNISLTLSGTALGTIVTTNLAFTTSTIGTTIDMVEAGFQEGDTILLERAGGGNNNKYVRIDRFTNDNKTLHVTPIDTSPLTANATSLEYTVSYASEEIAGLILSKEATNYSNYLNREAFIYRAHMDPETGDIIGEPFLIFRGIISKGSVTDNALQSSKVVWNLTSHWGDFVRIQGRMTSDSAHRALSVTGEPDVDALIRPEYAQDTGFMHAEQSINIMAIYQAMETRYKMKKRGGLAGLLGGKKLVEYEVEVDREVDLQFNLSSKYLPVVYGVQKVDSIPIFADTLRSDSSTIYVAHALCEGEIGGIYDIHIDDASTVCVDKADYDVRAGGGETIEIVCNGRADRGDVLAGSTYTTGVPLYWDQVQYAGDFWGYNWGWYNTYFDVTNNAQGAQGIQHEETYTFTSPIDTDLVIHTGKPDQKANSELVKVAAANNFKVQNDYYEGSLSDYWGPSHRLLDTAYVVGKYKVSEGEVTLPKLEFVVRGKVLECYNYDYSYLADDYQPDGAQSDFSIGDNVTIHRTSNDAQVGSTVMIIDKWSYYNTEGELSYRFRFSSNPQATDANPPTAFYMKNTSGDKWYMTTYDHQEASLVDIGTNPTATVTSATRTAGKLTLVLNSPSTAVEATLSAGKAVALTFEEVDTTTSYEIVSYNSTTDTLVLTDSGFGTSAIVTNINTNGFTCTVEPLSYLTLDSGDNATNYTGRTITLSRFDTNDAITHQETRVVTGYNSITKLATLDSPWPPTFIPTSGDTYSVSSKGDKRVSINPVVQLLDYLTSARYGKGLKQSDLNLPTFMESARLCDTQSDVTVQLPSTENISVGDEYRYAPSGRLVFQGTVRSVENVATYVNGTLTNFKQVTFKDVIGKLAYKWNDWRSYTAGDYVWNNGSVYLASGGTLPTAPTTGALSSITLSKVSGSGDPIVDISITDGYTSSGNPIIKKFTNTYEGFNSPGYSLYDSDDVKYWIYLGWDEPEQRFVTRHQMNQVINTSTPLFDNINSMLLQFNGIMRYANGKYEIGIKSAAPETFETYQTISEGDIIGDIKVQDKGQKSVYNSMAANIVDPQNKFAARSITFFNSDYLKEDKGIRRSGNFAMPGISNYYNARINIKQYLDESRYGLDISFTIDSKGYLLLTGEIIQVSYPRFNWSNKLFRVDNLNFQENGLVQVTATEHNDYAFLIGNIKSSPSAKRGEASGGSANPTAVATPAGPTNLAATTGGKGAIDLTWDNSASFKFATHNTEVWAASTNDRTQASLIYTTQATNLSHIVTEQSEVTKYYWVRHIVVSENNLSVPSDYYPLGSTSGIEGSATGAIDGTSGERGAGRWHIQVTALPTTSAEAATAWGSGSGNQPDAEVADDQAWFYTGTLSNPTSQTVWIYDGSSWNKQEEVIDGDLIVAGTITADQIKANTITANEINAEVGNFGQLVADIGTFGSIDTDTLDANSVIAREIQVFPEGGTAPTIDGTTLAGAGVDIKQDGDVYIGDASADKYVFWDQSEGTLTLRGELNAGDITAGTISADRISAGSIDADKIAAGAITADKIDADAVTAEKIDVTNLAAVSADLGAITAGTMQNSGVNAIPDAESAPTGSESGAFIDLTQGKFVFGDASKYILWDGTDLTLSGVAIDATSTIDAIAGVTVQEDGTQELEAATTFNFTTGLNVETNATTKVATVSLDFAPTLDTVTDNGNTTTNAVTVGSLTVSNDAVITGNLTVNGTTTTVNSNTVEIGDNIIVLNKDETGTPSQDAGIEVERGTSNNVSLVWDESATRWSFTNDGTTYYNIPVPSEYSAYSWTASDGSNSEEIVSGNTVKFVGSGATSVAYDNSTNTFTISSTDTDTDTTYSAATTSTLGLTKLFSGTTQTVAANTVSSTAGRTYGVQFNASNQMVVNVPWSDTNTTYSTATDTTLGLIKIGYTQTGQNYPVALANGQAYVNVPWTDNNTTYSTATDTTLGLIKIGYTENGKNYPVELDAANKAYVNVPWSDTNTTYSVASTSTAGLVKLGNDTDQTVAANAVTTTANRTYAIQLNASDQMVVNVPWTDNNTTYSVFTSSANGLVPASDGTGETGKFLKGDGTWATPTDTNTTYSVFTSAIDGLVPASDGTGETGKYLKGDGTWDIPTNTTYSVFTTSADGLVPAADGVGETGKFLKGDGTWATPTDTNTTYSAGSLLDLSGTTFNVDLSELTDMTEDMVSTDELVVLDGTTQKRKALSEIDLSLFNTGNLTAADAQSLGGEPSTYYLNTATTFGGDVSGTYNAIVVDNDSHTHQFNNLTNKTSGTGDYATTGDLVSGKGSGGVALTINDGYGNANVTWNHQNGTPEQAGNAARIEVNTDSTSGATMWFELKSNVAADTAVALTSVMNLNESELNLASGIGFKMNGTSVLTSARALQNVTNTNWDAAYTYSTVGHLPLAGGSVSGTITSTVAEDANILSWSNAGYLKRMTTQGGVQLSGDSSVAIHAGDHHTDYEADLGIANATTTENVYLTADGEIKFISGYQNGISTAKTATYSSAGNLTIPGTFSADGYNKSNWDTAYGWGDHSTAGYLTSYTDTNTTYSVALSDGATGEVDIDLTAGGSGSGTDSVTLKQGSNVTLSRSGDVVTISSTDTNTTYSTATDTTLGLVKIGYTESGKNYPVELDSGQMYVNVPWTDTNTTYSTATDTTLGLVKIGYTENGKNYPVELDSGQMYVNVPWTDNNTTYTAGNGLALSSGEFKVDDPANLSELTESTDATDDKIMLWDESASVWKYMTLDNLQDAIDTNTTYSVGDGGLTEKNFTSTLKTKLDGIDTSANNYSLPSATVSTLGGIKLESDTAQTVGANAVTATTGRTYGLQVNANGEGVINVPWTDTNTTYSAGTGLNLTGTEFSVKTAEFAPRVTGTTTLTQNSYSRIARILGDNLGSGVRVHLSGTTGSVVVDIIADILVNHYQDIHIMTQSGAYTQLDLKVHSNSSNEDFDLYAQYTTGTGTTLSLKAEYFPLSSETITVNPTDTAYTGGTELVHSTTVGMKMTQSSGNAHMRIDGTYYDGSGNSGEWNTAYGWGDHASAGYLSSIPTATASVLGGIKVGDRLTITNGVLSADVQGSSYTLPTASTTVKGGVKVGTNLEMNGEAIQLKNGSANFDTITAAVGTFTTVDTDVLNAETVIARTVQVYPDGGTAPTITGTTLAGSGAVIKDDGDVMIGDSAGKHIFYDQSAGSLAIRSGTSGSRTEFLGDVIKVFDGTTLRVKIGNLSA